MHVSNWHQEIKKKGVKSYLVCSELNIVVLSYGDKQWKDFPETCKSKYEQDVSKTMVKKRKSRGNGKV